MWKLTHINQYGDLVETHWQSLDEVQAYLEEAFKIAGEPFGFRCKYTPKEKQS